MLKPLTLFTLLLFATTFLTAQTVEEMTAQKEAKEQELAPLEAQLAELTGKVDALKGEIAGLTEQITPYPRWDKGIFGTVGFNFTGFNDWLTKDQPNTSAATIGFTLNGFANVDQPKSFWRNTGQLNLSWIKFDDKDNPDDTEDYQVAADAFNFSSLFGFKLTDKIAISTMGEYRTAVLDGKFNNPGYFDLGAGITWTPIKALVVVIHPGNYNFVFADDDTAFESSIGAKIAADYTRKFGKNVNWKSNLSTFVSYQDPSELSNWTWTNSFSTAVKKIGIGLDIGLRSSKQEANAKMLEDNPLQMFYILGLSYNF